MAVTLAPHGAQATHGGTRALVLAALVLSQFLALGSFFVAGVRLQFADTLWLATAAVLATLLKPGNLRRVPARIWKVTAAFLAALTLALVAAPGLAHGIKYAGYLALMATLTLTLAAALRADTASHVPNVIRGLLWIHLATNAGGALLGLAGVPDYGSVLFQGAFYLPVVRSVGFTDHPDRSALVYLVLYGLFVLNWRTNSRPADNILGWMTPFAALLTLAPASVLVFVLISLKCFENARNRSTRTASTALAISAIAAMLLLSFVAPVRDGAGGWSLIPAPRAIIQASALPTVAAAPLIGHGLAHLGATRFSTGYPPTVVYRPTEPHSAYLDLLATGGLVLLASWLGLYGILAWGAGRTWAGVCAVWLLAGVVHSINDERIVYAGLGLGAALALGQRRHALTADG